MTYTETVSYFVDSGGVERVRPSRQAAEHANRWALTNGLPMPYPDLYATQRMAVPGTWSKRRLEIERAAVARQLARHRIECSQCAAARGDQMRSCETGYGLARARSALTDAWQQAKAGQPSTVQQGGLW